MKYWLLKTEGDVYPIEALKKDGKGPWSGVRNFKARNYMRDEMRVDDLCLFYHASTKVTGVYGIAKVASAPYPDATQFDKKSDYYESRATEENPIWMLVDVAFVKKFDHSVTVQEMKTEKPLRDMVLWKASRLSIQPVSEKEYKHVVEMSKKKKGLF